MSKDTKEKKYPCTCGICVINDSNRHECKKCSVCQTYLCLSMATSLRTVCTDCILSNKHQLDKIFVHGKTPSGDWIDPASLRPIKTCKHCGEPELTMRCGVIIGCYKYPETTCQPNVKRISFSELRKKLNVS